MRIVNAGKRRQVNLQHVVIVILPEGAEDSCISACDDLLDLVRVFVLKLRLDGFRERLRFLIGTFAR